MKIDITLKVTPRLTPDAPGGEGKLLAGHFGTHFDVMDQEFPLDYTQRKAVVFDVSGIKDRDIGLVDIDLERVGADMFVAFYSGFIEEEDYGTPRYFKDHPQLSRELIEALVEKKISIIGVDFSGIRRGAEHVPVDQYCAERGVFVVENLCNLKAVAAARGEIVIHTYPMNYAGVTGLPCRVIAEI